jgi:hypothetical protein
MFGISADLKKILSGGGGCGMIDYELSEEVKRGQGVAINS